MELLAERKNAKIFEGKPWNFYEVKLPKLSDKEREFVKFVADVFAQKLELKKARSEFISDSELGRITARVSGFLDDLKEFKAYPTKPSEEARLISIVSDFVNKSAGFVGHRNEVIYLLIKELFDLGSLGVLLQDDGLEEIMVNAVGKPVFVFDRQYGICRTNLVFETEEELLFLVNRVSALTGRPISMDAPLLDGRLPDGSRVNATIPPATPRGPSVTIRKFRTKPFSITELISLGTVSSEIAAFLWACVDGLRVMPMNMLLAGSTSSGKTTTLNALSVFIPERERIVTVEDVLELNLFDREDWVAMEARIGILEKQLTLQELLRNSIRMRPDRIIVGEVRGPEAEDMFVAMDLGHQGVMCTLHANSASETVLRLKSAPMNVPTAMFTLLDLIVMQHRVNVPGQGLARRVTQVSEVSFMEERVLLNDIYSWERGKDSMERSNLPSQTI